MIMVKIDLVLSSEFWSASAFILLLAFKHFNTEHIGSISMCMGFKKFREGFTIDKSILLVTLAYLPIPTKKSLDFRISESLAIQYLLSS